MHLFLMNMKIAQKLYLTFFCTLISLVLQAQPELSMPAIPHMRQLIHDNIKNAEKNIINLTPNTAHVFAPTNDIDVNLQITQMLQNTVHNMRASIELDTTINDNDKYKWLRGIYSLLENFTTAYKAGLIKGLMLGDLMTAYEKAVALEKNKASITPVIGAYDEAIGNLLVNNFALQNNVGINEAKNLLILKNCRQNPDNILNIVGNNLDVPFADSLIAVVAHRNPDIIYDYLGAGNELSQKIKKVNDPLVQTIYQIEKLPGGRTYFAFLDEIYHKQITIDSIQKIKDTDDPFYKLLVNTEIKYAARMQMGDTPYAKQVLTDKLKQKAIEHYINEINGLHDNPRDAVRFKVLDNLAPQDLYYLCVLGEDDIYTSSYLGVYNRIFPRMAIPRSDTLLAWVHDDFYKKFIRMAAAYNVLDDFLKRMDKSTAQNLIKRFVNGLEKTSTLEDAVDVADSYASINDVGIRNLMLAKVQQQLQFNTQMRNERGIVIYNILNTIFLSMNPANHIDVSAKLGIIPVYEMPLSLLKDASGKVIIQQFFYGDKDGKNIFNAFLANFNNGNWRIINKPEWVEVKSIKGTTPIEIYANKPLDAEQDLDDAAQQHLCNYLDSAQIEPTVVIHRGHSYYVNSTIKRLFPSAKVILLGSCGGYNSLNDVLKTCPESHIIASKQVGTGVVNMALIEAITETLRQGKNLDWTKIWSGLQNKFTGGYKEKFDDYVPPQNNLGAMFIMAYNKAIEKQKNN
jgi:hypothetical protein